jgi:vancomycin resistance protein YoaR
VLAWLGLALGLRVAYDGKVLPGTHMAGVALAGASDVEVRRRLAGARGNAVTLTHGKTRSRIGGRAAGLDVETSAERAMAAGRDGPLRGLWSSVVSLVAPRVVQPVYPSDRPALRAVTAAAREVDRPPFFGALSIDPATLEVTVMPPRPGRAVDRRGTAAGLIAALRRGEGGELPMTVRSRPAVAPAEVRAVARQAERYLAVGLRLASAGSPVDVTPRQIAPILALETVEHAARPRVRLGVRRAPLASLVQAIAAERDRDPVDARIIAPAPTGLLAEKLDASWRPRRASVRVRPSRAGRAVGTEAAIAAIDAAVRNGRHEARLPLRTVPPHVSTAAAQKVTWLIGTFTTSFPCCQPRVTNIRLIAQAVDGTVVAPGAQFSLNGTVGRRTRAKGYVAAPFISDGGKLVPSVGGGVSQMSTTMYNAAFFAGVQLDAHQPHSLYIDRYPPGREATLDYPGIDLAWTNDTSAPVLVRASTTATSVSVSLYGDNGGRRVSADSGPRQPVQGRDFSVTVTRTIRHPGGRITSEPYTTTYDRPPPP